MPMLHLPVAPVLIARPVVIVQSGIDKVSPIGKLALDSSTAPYMNISTECDDTKLQRLSPFSHSFLE